LEESVTAGATTGVVCANAPVQKQVITSPMNVTLFIILSI
jgi:hypothetical protein